MSDIDYRKTMEQATQDVAVFMYGLRWWKDEEIKKRMFIDKEFVSWNGLKKVWQKMADNSKVRGTFLTTSKSFNEIFQDVVGEMHYYEHRDGITTEEILFLVTSEKLRTINK